ncbi:disulfide bond formation protein DsbB [Litoreibacter ponti]|uniref:Disulfide bond formation protein DsbB n=1 Tax=Litoreibacter ponti TaxID=1510457 RepID=A0A2T6BIE3_9RHOB|nr:disulfide bond formation protein B [Litoreibacter ponti]PTX55822.1 disulfide bond formation protein DsbB [Litoreibacter ponti]
MTLSRIQLVLVAAGGSAALLGGAFLFQLAGYPPCKMCLWQRWPHAAAIVVGALFVVLPSRILALMGAGAALITAGIGAYHAGVEQGWWEGPSTCSSGDISNLSPEELLEQILNATLVRCDEIAWQLAGISMAGWNAILSLGLALIWITAARRSL